MIAPLEERLLDVSQDAKQGLIDVLRIPRVSEGDVADKISNRCGRNYTQNNLHDFILEFYRDNGVTLKSDVDFNLLTSPSLSSLNKEPAKLIGYGIGNAEGMPAELMNGLTFYENLYLMAGLFYEKGANLIGGEDRNYERLTQVELVSSLIEAGIYHMNNCHNNVPLFTGGRKPAYTSSPNLPYDDEIIERVRAAKENVYDQRDAFVNLVTRNMDNIKEYDPNDLFSTGELKQQAIQAKQAIQNALDRCPFRVEFMSYLDTGARYNGTDVNRVLRRNDI